MATCPIIRKICWAIVERRLVIPNSSINLNLGNEARMNVPGRSEGNWRWRFTDDTLSTSAFDWLRNLTAVSNRTGAREPRGL